MIKFRWEKEFKETPIGKIPKDWEVKELGEISSHIQYGYTQSAELEPVGPKFLRITDIVGKWNVDWDKVPYCKIGSKEKEKYRLKDGDIVIARTGAYVGSSIIIENPPEAVFASYLIRVQMNRKMAVPKFVHYFLKSGYFIEYIRNSHGGSAQPHANAKVLSSVKVPLPTKEEQQRIATVLSWFDDLIENKRRQNEILEKMAMAIFKSWFIDFEPFQDEEFVYREELDMEIPKGWEVKPIGELVNFRYGKGLPERKRKRGPYPVVGSSGIVGYHNEYLTKGPTLVIGRKGNAGSIQLILEPNYPIDTVFFSDENTPVEIVFYLYHYLKVRSLQSVADSDTAVPGLSINLLNLFEVVVPPKPILERFHSLVEPLFRKIIINEKEIMVLKKARDTLLPQLVFGRLRVVEV